MGSTLAMVKTPAEQQALTPKISQTVFIGLYRDPRDTSRWLWVDGTQANYTHWYKGEPNGRSSEENCGEMYPTSHAGRWNDIGCSGPRGYICEIQGYACNNDSFLYSVCWKDVSN